MAVVRLRDKFGIEVITNPNDFNDIPLDGEIDLHGGNRSVAYQVNEAVKLRVLSKSDASMTTTLTIGAGRLHECGFLLRVGRAGIWSSTLGSRLPCGTLIQEGVYVLEEKRNGKTEEFTFDSQLPTFLDARATSTVHQKVFHPKYGTGQLLVANPMLADDDSKGLPVGYRGSIVFSTYTTREDAVRV